MSERERHTRHDPEDAPRPDEPVEEFEDDSADIRRSQEREAGLTALGGPLLGAPLFPEGTGGGEEAVDGRSTP